MSDFFKSYNNNFFAGFVPLAPLSYTIVIIYMNDYKKEIHCIENPWAYINEVKKNPNVKNVYIQTN
jgi:uncharacterized membrane protein